MYIRRYGKKPQRQPSGVRIEVENFTVLCTVLYCTIQNKGNTSKPSTQANGVRTGGWCLLASIVRIHATNIIESPSCPTCVSSSTFTEVRSQPYGRTLGYWTSLTLPLRLLLTEKTIQMAGLIISQVTQVLGPD